MHPRQCRRTNVPPCYGCLPFADFDCLLEGLGRWDIATHEPLFEDIFLHHDVGQTAFVPNPMHPFWSSDDFAGIDLRSITPEAFSFIAVVAEYFTDEYVAGRVIELPSNEVHSTLRALAPDLGRSPELLEGLANHYNKHC